MDMEKYLDLFVSEATEHIQAAEKEADRLKKPPPRPETLNSLFRHFHSIKGMAASMGFGEIASLSHAVEDLFDRLRKGGAPPGMLVDLVMEALDSTSAMVAWAAMGEQRGEMTVDTAAIIGRVRASIPPLPAGGERRAQTPALVHGIEPVTGRLCHCVVTIDPRAEFPGARAALVLRKLEQLGHIVDTTPARDALQHPDFDGRIVVDLTTERPEAAILAAVKDLHDLQRFEVREGPATPAGTSAAPGTLSQGAETADSTQATVRIPTATLDRLLDSISAMITRRGALTEAIKTRDFNKAREGLDKLTESIDDLRGQVMLIRLMPFENITPRLTRMVRELCRKTGKRVALEIVGAEVSLDRSVLEEIIDPINHILRNAVDHGIEPPDDRELMGKSAEGRIRIDVSREGDQVLVVLEDDGKGMDSEAIKRAALSGGFATESELSAMDEQQVLLLTTIPGFSTAPKVTEVSGRGVGMDVVRTRIEALHGHISISSRRGKGTRLQMTLPLTVAVIDAFVVECQAGLFAVPAGAVARVEIVEPERIRTTHSGSFLSCSSREDADGVSTDQVTYIPLVRLDDALGSAHTGPSPPPTTVQVLAYKANGARAALAVDRIRERREVVVKPLGPPLERLRKYSGAALLDDGTVALILDLVNLSGA